MRLILAITAAVLLTGCSTVREVTGNSAIDGQPLDAAVAIYGPWEQLVVLEGVQTYIWRRHYTAESKDYYCELRVETGYRKTISRSVMQGFPDACRLFSVRYRAKVN